jgi:hypothetical protein
MTISWDPQADFLDAADGLEAVTFATSGGATTAVTGALRMRITEREAAASGRRYTQRDVRWHLPAEQVASPPQVGATITDNQGTTWTILQVDHDTRASRWRCWCRLVPISSVLSDRIHIQQASWMKDDHGALLAAWGTWKIDLPARVRRIEAAMRVEHNQRVTRATHLVYLNESLELFQHHRLFHPATGSILHIVGYEMSEQIDALFLIRAVRTPWPMG